MCFVYEGHCDYEYSYIKYILIKCGSPPSFPDSATQNICCQYFCFEVQLFLFLHLLVLKFQRFNSMDVTRRPLYTGMSDESIRLSNSVLCASVQRCYSQMNWLYGLGSLMFKISPIMSLFSVCHFFQYSFLCPYSLLPSVTSHFNVGAFLAHIWQLG